MKIVETQFYTYDSLTLRSGITFGPVTLAYETYGELNEKRDNAILLFHALSGSQHAAGFNPASRARSTDPSVCPARTSTPPSRARNGLICPGRSR